MRMEMAYNFLVVPLIPGLDDHRTFPGCIECDDVGAINVREQVVVWAKVVGSVTVVMVVVMALVATVSVVMIMWHEEIRRVDNSMDANTRAINASSSVYYVGNIANKHKSTWNTFQKVFSFLSH